MTVSAAGVARVSYAGNDVTTAFTTPVFIANSDIVAVLVTDATGAETLLVLTTHYTLTGGSGAAGTLTMLTAPATGETLVIYIDPTISQEVDPVNGDPLDVNTEIEQPLDKLTLIARRQTDLVERSLRLSEGETGITADEMLLPVDRASKYLGFDADKKPIATAGTTDTTVHSAFIATLHDDPDAATARTTLGAAASGAVGSSGITQNTGVLLGRTTASAGAVEEITPGADMTFAAGVLGVAAASDTVAGKVELAVQSEMEAATDVGRATAPGRLHFHPGMSKLVARMTDLGSSPPTVTVLYNALGTLTPSRAGAGDHTLTWTNSLTNPNAQITTERTASTAVFTTIKNTELGATSVGMASYDLATTPTDPLSILIVVYGDLA